MATVKVNLNNLPKGQKVEVPGLGLFKNGESTNVDAPRWDRFKRRNPQVEGDTLEISTEAAKEATKAHAKLREAVDAEQAVEADQEPEVTPLSEYKKDELVEVAGRLGIDTEVNGKPKSKEQLITEISATQNQGG